MSRASRRRPRTDKTYQHKLNRLKKWYAKREQARAKWDSEEPTKGRRLKKDVFKPLKPLSWYVENLRQTGQGTQTKKTTTTRPKRQIGGWW